MAGFPYNIKNQCLPLVHLCFRFYRYVTMVVSWREDKVNPFQSLNINLMKNNLRIPLKSETRRGCPLTPCLSNIVLEAQAKRKKKRQLEEIKKIQSEKEEDNSAVQITGEQ